VIRLLIPILLFSLLQDLAFAQETIGPEEAYLYRKGRYVYERMCVYCHGQRGKGDGEWSHDLKDRPRNFRMGVFKFRSTPTGYLPTDEDLTRTIRHGISGTAMPTFQTMSDTDIKAIIAYIKNLSYRWRDPKYHSEPIELPQPPDWFSNEEEKSARIDAGNTTFQTTCMPCHGTDGKGDGPSSSSLIDAWDHPIKPGNLTQKHHKSGDSIEDLYRTIALGLDGTPMIGYREIFKPNEIWELIAFIKSIESQENPYLE